ncbi:DEK domain-containing chromatin-associated protein 1-like [Andrographis paniculata]|uniref:DEK domain-containing chromatin-associated protein 1-like n=1 Tax=Andrographis paniculata TaxID=175694 RepID=UPI0021E958B0|nr:DEK domain-containing chromatin-associated protein 1-like [Andrographis paniculata]
MGGANKQEEKGQLGGEVAAGKAEEKGKGTDVKEEGNAAGEEEGVKAAEKAEDGVFEQEENEEERTEVVKESETERGSDAGDLASPRTDRPTRERKMVERFTINSTPRSSGSKSLAILQGQGTQLKDIPNVTFKLSKRKADENLQLFHTILFGKKAKVHNLKKNIGHFSGFVWLDNEGKERAKVKGKLDKCVKEKLLYFCDVLDIPVNRATVKKEELSSKLMEFLESPHAMTENLLVDKEKGKGKKNTESASTGPGSSPAVEEKSTKKQKIDSDSGKKRKHDTGEEDDTKSEQLETEDNLDGDNKVSGDESDQKNNDNIDQETNGGQDKPKKQKVVTKSSSKKSAKKDDNSEKSKTASNSAAKASNTPGKSTKGSASSASKEDTTESKSKSESKMKQYTTNKAESGKEVEKNRPAKNTASGKASKKDKGEGKSKNVKKPAKEPSYEELQAVVVAILKEVDFNTATLSDILRQLGKHFGMDLMHRKSDVKNIITEAIKNMSDNDEDDEKTDGSAGEDESGDGESDDEE